MECNKEEAVRARETAERRMESKDFVGAHKLALKAQKLYPGLENISQMLTVCEVHVSSGFSIGNEMNWYEILQVSHDVDELAVKKQFRKLALVLHPDKNKFPGAEAAFKLIVEANTVLSDQAKRHLYDTKRIYTAAPKQQPPQTNKSSFAKQSDLQFFPKNQQKMPTASSFWTICTSCNTKYQHYRTFLNRMLRCQTCSQPFLAHEINSPEPSRPNTGPLQSHIPNQQKRKRKAEQKSRKNFNNKNTGIEDVEQPCENKMDSPFKKKKMETSKKSKDIPVNSDVASSPGIQEIMYPLNYPEPEFHDFDKDRVRENFEVDQIWAVYDDTCGMPRWYARIRKIFSGNSKLQILWLEADPKNDVGRKWLKEKLPVACGNFKHGRSQDTEDFLMFSHLASWQKGASRSSYKIYPKKNEVWAVFKGWNIQWSSNPAVLKKFEYQFVEILCDYSEDTGVEVELLVKLKGFTSLFQRSKNTENTSKIPPSELLRFSHRVPYQQMTGDERPGVPDGAFELDPAAVFSERPSSARDADKGFDKCTDAEPNAESLKPGDSNMTAFGGPRTVNLVDECTGQTDKVSQSSENLKKGGHSEFVTEEEVPTFASPEEPNGTEKQRSSQNKKLKNESASKCKGEKDESVSERGALSDFKEEIQSKESLLKSRLSPQKVVSSCEEKPNSAGSTPHVVDEEGGLYGNKPSNVPSSKCHFDEKLDPVSGTVSPNGALEEIIPPVPVFYSFELKKIEAKFRQGQIWALYSTVDGGLPKYYARIKKVVSPEYKFHVTILNACPESEEEIWWSRKELPFGCGKFKVQNKDMVGIDKIRTFSHLVGHTYQKGQYLIFPRKGEVWAVYKGWSSTWTFKDLNHCEYMLVEIIKYSDSVIEVMTLKAVDGFKTIFRGCTKMELPRDECLRFSHHIPSFRLTEEGGERLNGCFELDPLALPDSFLQNQSELAAVSL